MANENEEIDEMVKSATEERITILEHAEHDAKDNAELESMLKILVQHGKVFLATLRSSVKNIRQKVRRGKRSRKRVLSP